MEEYTKQELTDIEFLVKLRIMCLEQEKPHLSRMSIEYYNRLLEKTRRMG